jgi:hypothetical protein
MTVSEKKTLSLSDRGENYACGLRHMFTAPYSEVLVNPTWAGDLAEDMIPYSCVTAPDYAYK